MSLLIISEGKKSQSNPSGPWNKMSLKLLKSIENKAKAVIFIVYSEKAPS